MTIAIYSKPDCDFCEKAKQKMAILGFTYQEHSIEYHTTDHDSWRVDGSVDVLAAHAMLNSIPLFRIEGQFHDYPSAMRTLKRMKRP